MSQNKDYLGDGVYADFDGTMVTLTVEDGIQTHETIHLEPDTLVALGRYVERMKVFDSKPPVVGKPIGVHCCEATFQTAADAELHERLHRVTGASHEG